MTGSSTKPPANAGEERLRARPRVLTGRTYRAPTPVGTAFVTINRDENALAEVFVTVGRAGSDVAADAEAIGRLISLAFRIPSSLSSLAIAEAVIDQLSGIGGSSSLGFGGERVRSLADAVAKVLAEHPREGADAGDALAQTDGVPDLCGTSASEGTEPRSSRPGDFCPDCGQQSLVYQEGCRKCYSCGFSSC